MSQVNEGSYQWNTWPVKAVNWGIVAV